MNDRPRKVPLKKAKRKKRGQDGTSRVKKQDTAPRHCEICRYDKIVQLHRIHPGKDRNKLWPNGGTYVLGNTIRLCPNHHAEADRGWITRDELQAIVQERIDEADIRCFQDVRTLPHIRCLSLEEAKVACEREETQKRTERPRPRAEGPSVEGDYPTEELSGEGCCG